MDKKEKNFNFLIMPIIGAILFDLMFPKTAAQGAMTPDFTDLTIDQNKQEIFISKEIRLIRANNAKPRKVIYVVVTAYSSTPDQTDSSPFITASGAFVHDGTLAANFLPFGTKVRLPDYSGDKVYTVEDRMNQRYWHRADIWMETREAAKQFGVRRLKMEIY